MIRAVAFPYCSGMMNRFTEAGPGAAPMIPHSLLFEMQRIFWTACWFAGGVQFGLERVRGAVVDAGVNREPERGAA